MFKINSFFVKHPFAFKQLLSIILAIISLETSAATYTYVLQVGQSKTVSPGDWCINATVSDESIISCTMDPSGTYTQITALKPGTATCIVQYSNGNGYIRNTYIIEVIDITSITIPQTLCIKLGQTYKFSPVIQDSRMTNYILEWNALDTSIASIDNEGNLITHSPGSTQIMCTYKDKSSVCLLSVEPIYISDILFEITNYEITEYNQLKIEPLILPDNATTKNLSWESSNTSVAIVDSHGVVTSLSKGKAVITATTKDGSEISSSFLLSVIPEEDRWNDVELTINDFAQCTAKVEQGSPFSLNILSPSDDWKIQNFVVDGIESIEQLTTGEFFIDKVEQPIKIQVSYTYDGTIEFYDITGGSKTAIKNLGIELSTEDGQLNIYNLKSETKISIYTLGGHLIGSYSPLSNALKIKLDSNYYIINIDGNCFKIKL